MCIRMDAYGYNSIRLPSPLRPTPQWVIFGAGGKLSTPWGDGSWGGVSSAARLYIYVFVNVQMHMGITIIAYPPSSAPHPSGSSSEPAAN